MVLARDPKAILEVEGLGFVVENEIVVVAGVFSSEGVCVDRIVRFIVLGEGGCTFPPEERIHDC